MEGIPAHVIVRGNDKQPIFKTEGDRIYFHRSLTRLAAINGVSVHAYVLMSNHVHLLATASNATSLPTTLQSLGRLYVRYFNGRNGRTGTLWEGRYRSTLVETERYFLTCQRYIELNPVRAGVVGHPQDYPWSSYQTYASGRPDDLVTPHPLHEEMGSDEQSRSEGYRALFENDIDAETLAKIRESTQKGWALGEEAFRRRLEASGNRRTYPLPLGRPARSRRAEPGAEVD